MKLTIQPAVSGVNTGDVTLAAVGSSPSANGASLSGQVLTLQPADSSNPGVVSTASQNFVGAKTFDTAAVFTNGLAATNASVKSGGNASLADDAAMSFTPVNNVGGMMIFIGGAGNGGMALYRAASSPSMAILVGGANLNATTGALTGTTGTDTKVTISAADTGIVYIENRSGGAKAVSYLLV